MDRKLQENKKNRSRYGAIGIFLLACVIILSFVSCGKGKKGEGQTTPAGEQGQNGFAAANPELVKKNAEKYASTTAVSVGNTDISMEKAMFLIYSMEVQGNSYAVYHEAQYGTDYWEMVYDEEGRTTREIFKEETIDALIQYAVLYDCAVKNGMSLTAEETAQNDAYVEQLKSILSAEETERGGFTTENLREVCAWIRLAEKYYDKMTENLGVSLDSVRKTINKEDYKEYETEYLYLATTYYDEEYNVCEEGEEEKKAVRAQMQDYYEQVSEGITFDELEKNDEALVRNVRTFLAKGEGAEEAYAKAAAKLSQGEVSEPVQTEYGVYLIRMLDDECTKTYEAVVKAEYELQRSEAFEAAYKVLLAEYTVAVNEEAWRDIVFGATVSILE